MIRMTERQANSSDADWLWNLYRDLLKEYIEIQWGWDQSFQEANFAEHLPVAGFIIMSDQDADVAAYLVNEEPDHFYLKMLLVTKAAQGQGVGVSILDRLKSVSREAEKPLRLSVFDTNPVSGFYTKNGFQKIGRKEGGDIFEYAP